jgi:hypothetical protein
MAFAYVLRDLAEPEARWWFVAIHVPLFWVLIALTHHAQAKLQNASRMSLAAFCIMHALLHLRLRNDPFSMFTTPLSWSFILGAAALGAAYLALVAYKPSTQPE